MYAAAYSNLSSSIATDVDELCEGNIPAAGSGDILLVYSHHLKTPADYKTPTNPVLVRAYTGLDGNLKKDTLTVYPETDVSSSAEVLHKVLTEVKEKFPARSYGLIFSSHARGWLPVGYTEPSSTVFFANSANREVFPLTKWFGIENVTGSGIDTRELADALPMKLDFFLMDACLMGCVEVAYELKEKCRLLVFSPTEVLSNGFIYSVMGSRLLNVQEPDVKQVCVDYFDYYMAQPDYYQSATITMVDCAKTEVLAKVCSEIISAHRDSWGSIDRTKVQAYFYNEFHWFYDLRDIMVNAGATEAELQKLDAALDDCLLYTAATPKFFNLKLDRVCGLSMYLPYPDKEELNNYYKTLSWNKAIGLIQ